MLSAQIGLYAVALLGGVAAGVINTLAGNGSLVTLPLLGLLGLPTSEANATNRVGVVFQCAVASAGFVRSGALKLNAVTLWWVAPALIGAILGAALAVEVSDRALDLFIGAVMLAMLCLTAWRAKRSTPPAKEASAPSRPELELERPSASLIATLALVGLYGGFIQAGVGVMLLLSLTAGAGLKVASANALKMIIALGLASAALALFMTQGMISWSLGLLMAAGQSLGALLGVRFLSRNARAEVWVRRVLVVVLIAGVLHYLAPEIMALFFVD